MSSNNIFQSSQYHVNDHQNRKEYYQLQDGRRNERYHGQTHHQNNNNQQCDYPNKHHYSRQQLEEYSNNALSSLPPGWVELTDPRTGATYYANSTTQETQWDRPLVATSHFLPANNQSQQQQQQQQHQPIPNRSTAQIPVPIVNAQQPYNRGIHTDGLVGLSTGEANQNFYTANGHFATYPNNASTNPSIWHSENIVHMAREMMETMPKDQSLASDVELHSLTPGQVADLCKLQRRIHQQQQEEQECIHPNSSNSDNRKRGNLPPYTPINPYTMPISGSMLTDRTEPGRLDVRMNSLRRELENLGNHRSLGV
jgi:hypothetical protein